MNYSWSTYVDGAVVVGYLLFCLVVGFYKNKKITNIREYALSDGKTPMVVLICTLFATYVGAGVLMGTIQKVYIMGAIFMFAQFFTPLKWVLNSMIFAKNIQQFKGCLGIGDIMHKFYGKLGRVIANFINIFGGIGTIAAQIMAMGFLAEYFFHIDKLYGVFLGCGVLTFYSAFGGIRAVMLTDTLQFFIFYLGIPLGCIWAAYEIGQVTDGGVIAAFKAMPSQYHSIEWTTDNVILFASLVFFAVATENGGDSAFIQRFLIVGNAKKLRDSLLALTLISLPFIVFVCALGILVKIKAPEIDPNQAFSYFIDNYLPVGLKGLMIAGLLAVMMSTADSYLNTSSIIISNELIKPIFPKISAMQEVTVARIATFVVAMLATCLALVANNILDLIWFIANFWDPLMSVPMFSGFLGLRTNSKSFIGATIIALTFTCIGAYIDGKFATVSLLIGIIGSAIGLFGMHFLQKAQGIIMPDPLGDANTPRQTITEKSHNFINQLKELLIKSYQMPPVSASMFWIFIIFTGVYSLLASMILVLKGDLHVVEKIELFLRIIGYVASFALLLANIVGGKRIFWLSQTNTRLYQALIVFCLPFTASYLMFQSNFYIYYNSTFILSLILLYFFTNGYRFVLYSIFGIILGYILANFTKIDGGIEKFGDMQIIGSLCYFLTFVAFFFEQHRYKKQQAKIADNMIYSGSLAHEMRSPLATIQMLNQMLSSILQNKNWQPDEIKQMVKSSKLIGEKCAKGLDSIDAILNVIRADFMSDTELKPANIIDVTNQAIKFCDLPQNIKVRVKNQNAFDFLGNYDLMVQVISNLILNSIKHGKSTEIELWCEADETSKYLHYRDNGTGIDESIIDKIFDEFYTTDTKNGSGVGLAFCKKVLESFGGSITCVPNQASDTGAYFILSFPKI